VSVLLDLEPRHSCIHVLVPNQVPYRRGRKKCPWAWLSGHRHHSSARIPGQANMCVPHWLSPTAAPPCRSARLRWLPGSLVVSRRAPRRGRLSTSCVVNVI